MNAIKIIFFDIDGTLIDPRTKRISERTLEALQRLKQTGIRLCIATGRSPMQVPRFPGVSFDALITYNGSYCFDASGELSGNPLKKEDVATIIRNAGALGRPLSLAMKNRLAANGTDRDLADYFAISGLPVEIDPDFDATAQEETIYQIMMGCRNQDFPAILRGVRNARITTSWDRAVDIIPADSGKGAAAAGILRHFHLSREEAMAFGDGDNDLELLQTAGLGVAMGNASPRLQAVARDVCGSVDQDGIYFYCKKLGLL